MARQRHRRLVLEGSEHDGTLARVGNHPIEGSPRVVHDCSATSLYAVGTETQTMMQLCASAASSGGGGPILTHGMQAMELAGAPPPRTVIGDLSQTVPTGSETFRPSPLISPSMCGTEDDALRHERASPMRCHKAMSSSARQGHDHLLAQAVRLLGAQGKPLGQRAVLLELEEAPCQLNHSPPHPCITRSGEPLFPTFLSALIRRTGQAPVARHSAPVAQVS